MEFEFRNYQRNKFVPLFAALASQPPMEDKDAIQRRLLKGPCEKCGKHCNCSLTATAKICSENILNHWHEKALKQPCKCTRCKIADAYYRFKNPGKTVDELAAPCKKCYAILLDLTGAGWPTFCGLTQHMRAGGKYDDYAFWLPSGWPAR